MDCKPFPITNGVTVVMANMADHFQDEHHVYVYDYKKNELSYLKEKSILVQSAHTLEELNFDITICSPILALKEFNRIRHNLKCDFIVGWLNDCYTHVLYRHAVVSKKVNHFDFDDVRSLLKIPLVYFFENVITSKADILIGQSDVEKKIYEKWFPLSPDCKVMPNGTQFSLDNNELDGLLRDGVAIVASFNKSYIKVAKWFISNVWTRVNEKNPSLKLHVLGRNSDTLYQYVKKNYPNICSSIVVENYYPDIKEFYKKRKLVVSPVFKNLGLINKTIEAMHCGCIVIGDKGAFNGLVGFKDITHGVVVNDEIDFAEKIIQYSCQSESDISISAHNFIENNFSWKKNAEILLKCYEERARKSEFDT